MTTPKKTPQKRRRTLHAMPHLMAYKHPDERMGALRANLDPRSLELLYRLSVAEDVAESTWFSVLADRLIRDVTLQERIETFIRKRGDEFHTSGLFAFKLYTIPHDLRLKLNETARSMPVSRPQDARGVTSPWLRLALAYCAFEERGWRPQDLASTPFAR